MNTGWLKLSKDRKVDILNQASNLTGLPPIAIEKDWWVTLTLFSSFSFDYSKHIVFKGGTSLSKGWNLIERFSEDIDLAIDRNYFGFEGDISKNQIKKLRKKSCEFISNTYASNLTNFFSDLKVVDQCEVKALVTNESDRDPQIIEINYNSVLEKSGYLPSRVLIEVSSRSLIEPSEQKQINSLIDESFKDQSFATKVFSIHVVLPQRTFLEKIFLIHEQFSQIDSKPSAERLSRHLYDIEKLMDTNYGKAALEDADLFSSIVNHRSKFNVIRGLDYSNHTRGKITIIPPDEVIKEWEIDYNTMKGNMIYGKALEFKSLLKRIEELQNRINQLN